jgi:class 3 adenylate cyclase/tetratricopeptide (TPR) repeat protein
MPACPACGKELPGEFPFCPFCGAPLTDRPAAASLEERKVVSVLFCDLVGFTAASDAADPEDVRARIRPYHQRLRAELERFGGTVEKFVGDAVMAVFGAPATHEDDAERAVRAGLRILEAIGELNDADPALSLQVRVGIDTGEAVVALDARPEQGEGIVTGDVVNTASRLQAVAPVDAIAVSEQTYRATERVFKYEPLATVEVKGKAEPLALWRPLAPRARFGSDVIRAHTTPLVGRELERTLLVGTFERAATQSSCQLVTVVGEPGVGKSRLCAELFGYIEQRPGLVRWRQGRCLPYGEGIAFWALGEIVKAECGILESDSPNAAEAKLDRALPADDPDLPWLRARLGPLVGAGGEPAGQQESFMAWRRFCESLAATGPAVLVFEDLHWADPALLAFLEHLADWSQDVPLLLLCTARPELYEQHASWAAGLRNASAINLEPLSEEETSSLIGSLLHQAVLPAGTQELLLERAGGNPLYAEEFVRLLSDRGELAEAALVPESLQALIAARLDTLSQERKGLLQDAAVMGKVFWAGAVAEMCGRSLGEVELAFHELARKELVRPARTSSMAGEAEYGFWHLLVRDVAYNQIPRAARAERHRAAAAWLEQKAGERAEDLADVLAYHYTQAVELAQAAGDTQQAAELATPARRFLALAGERALGLDTTQAEAKLARALELTPDDDPQRAGLLLRWAQALFQAGRLRESAAALEQALARFRTGGDVEGQARAAIQLSTVARRLGDGRSRALADDAVTVLKRTEPGAALVDAYTHLASTQCVDGHDAEAITTAEEALSLADQLGLPVPARALGFYGFARARLGDPEGLAEMERALALMVEQGAGRDAAVLQSNLAVARIPLEGPASTLGAYDEGIAFSEQRGLTEVAAVLAGNRPEALASLGRTQEALDQAAPLVAAAESSGDTVTLRTLREVELAIRLAQGHTDDALTRADWLLAATRAAANADSSATAVPTVAAARLAGGQPDHARDLLAELDQTAGAHDNLNYAVRLPGMVRTALAAADPSLARTLTDKLQPHFPLNQHALTASRAQLAEYAGEHSQAAALYADAAQAWREFGFVHEQAHALLGEGRCLLALGDTRAEQPLTEARDLFASMGYEPALAETEKLLAGAPASAGQGS